MLPHHPACKHAVLFYKDDAWLREQVNRHVLEALHSGRPAIVIAKPALLQELKIAIHREHVQGAPFGPQRGALVTLDAEETLALICVDGRPDAGRFMSVVGEPVRELSANGQAAAYGEMVGILCERGQYADAIELEQYWNDLLTSCDASLYCGYHDRLFRSPESRDFYRQVRGAHDAVREDPHAFAALAA